MGGHASSMVSTGNEGCASTDTFDGIGGHVCVNTLCTNQKRCEIVRI